MARQIIEFGEYAPDMPSSGNPGLQDATNVYRYAQGYRPIGSFSKAATALSAACTGFHSDRRVNGDIITFAATATSLNWLNGGTSWTDKSLAAYSATSSWEFARMKDRLIAVALGVTPQYFLLTTAFDPSVGANKWANCAGSPPQFRHVAVCKRYVVCGYEVNGGTTYDQRLRWSIRDVDFTGANDWTSNPTVTGSDVQDLEDGGPIRKIIGGEYTVVMQERAIRRMMPTSDTSLIFQIDRVEFGRGAMAPGCVASQGNFVYYLSEDGFFVFDGSVSTPIGNGKVDKTFFNDVRLDRISQMKCSVDPYNKLIIWFYPSKTSDTGVLDKGICYNYADGTWTPINLGINVEFVAAGISAGYTLDQIANIYSSLDDVRPPLDDNFWQGGYRALFFFNASTHQMGLLRGDPLATTMVTGDFQLGGDQLAGRKKMTRFVRPGVDSDSAAVRVGARTNLTDDPAWSDSATQNSRGIAKARKVGRYHRVEITTPAGADFVTQHGCEVEFEQAGDL